MLVRNTLSTIVVVEEQVLLCRTRGCVIYEERVRLASACAVHLRCISFLCTTTTFCPFYSTL